MYRVAIRWLRPVGGGKTCGTQGSEGFVFWYSAGALGLKLRPGGNCRWLRLLSVPDLYFSPNSATEEYCCAVAKTAEIWGKDRWVPRAETS